MSKKSKKARLRRELWQETDGYCVYCGEQPPPEEKTVDHIWPKSRGGNEVLYNLVPACGDCNVARGTTFPASLAAHARWVGYVRKKEANLGIAETGADKRKMMSEGKEKVSPMPGVKFRLVDFEDRGICEVTGQVMNGIRYRSEHGHDGVLHWDCWRSENLVIVEPETALDGVGGEALGTPSPDPVEPVREEGVVTLDDLPMSDRLLRTITWNKGPALGGGGTNGIKDGVSWWWDGDKLLLIGGTRGGQIVDLVRVSADEHFLNFEDVETGENHDWSPEDIWWWAKVEDDMLPPAASYDVPPAEHLNS